jgi:hypothetical protein
MACVGVTTRGVRASHVTHRVPATTAQAARFGYAHSCQGQRCERTTATASAQLTLVVGHGGLAGQTPSGTAFQARSRRARRG